jgi:hypothetical protein
MRRSASLSRAIAIQPKAAADRLTSPAATSIVSPAQKETAVRLQKSALIAFASAVSWPAANARAARDILYQIEALAGAGFYFDISNDTSKNKVTAVKCGKYTGQFRFVEPFSNLREGYVRLRTKFTGENKCLDIVKDDAKTSRSWRHAETTRGKCGRLPLLVPTVIAVSHKIHRPHNLPADVRRSRQAQSAEDGGVRQ